MKTRTLLVASVAAAFAVLLTPRLISQEVPTIKTEIRSEAEPGPEHWLLQGLAGDWTVEARHYRGPGEEYGTDRGTASLEAIAGERFLLCRTVLGVEPFDTEQVLILGYDRRASRYTAVLSDSFETSYQQATGVWDPATKRIVLRGEDLDPRTGGAARFTVFVHLEGQDQFRIEIQAEVPGGTPIQVLESTYRREGPTLSVEAGSGEAGSEETVVREALIQEPVYVLAVLLAVLAGLFAFNRTAFGGRFLRVIPLLVFAYFVPTALSNTGVIPIDPGFALYQFIKTWLLPASLVLLTLSVDIPAIFRLGPKVLALFLSATAAIVIGGPLAYLAVGLVWPEAVTGMGDQAWKGMAALSGSWIGGGANFVAIGESVGALDSTISLMVIVDVAIANIWMAFLLGFAGRDEAMDAKIGADRSTIDDVRERVMAFQKDVERPTNLPDLLLIVAIAIGGAALATVLSGYLPAIGDIVKGFTWVVILVTTLGVGLSFTKLRNLEGAGASSVGSVFLYLLVASIGAKADFLRVGEIPGLILIGALWMVIHVIILFFVRRLVKAPIFFLAVGSKANIGGAASAPIVASAFHPALATVGVLLAVGGYVLGTYAGLLCAFLLELAHGIVT